MEETPNKTAPEMTGPEHYGEGVRLLQKARDVRLALIGGRLAQDDSKGLVMLAQAHFSAALLAMNAEHLDTAAWNNVIPGLMPAPEDRGNTWSV